MNAHTSGGVRRSALYRQKREAAGELQVSVWLDQSLRDKLDDLMKSGLFKNKSDLIALALREFEVDKGR